MGKKKKEQNVEKMKQTWYGEIFKQICQSNPHPSPLPRRGNVPVQGNSKGNVIEQKCQSNPHSSPLHWRGNKMPAFTLTEVLITVAIVGVVAAMTLPSLIQLHYNHITEVRLKKFYSDFNNAIRMSEVENGSNYYWDDFYNAGSNKDRISVTQKYFAPYMKLTQHRFVNSDKSIIIVFEFPDGSAFAYYGGGATTRDIQFFPMNWQKCLLRSSNKKQAKGVCMFSFLFVSPTYGWNSKPGRLEPYNIFPNDYPCAKGKRGDLCTEVIRKNGWKIPRNYPFKIQY